MVLKEARRNISHGLNCVTNIASQLQDTSWEARVEGVKLP
jgi:hypothetical protein